MQYLHPVYLLTHTVPLLVLGALISPASSRKTFARLVFAPFRLVGFLLAIALIGLTGCTHTEKLAEAKGPLFALNPDHWHATPQDLKDPSGMER